MIEEEDQLPDAPAEETVTEDASGEASPYAPDPLPATPTQPKSAVPAPTEASGNVFDQFDKQANVFDQFDKSSDGESTATGAFVRGAAKGVVPAAAALPAIGFGATLGAEAGAVGGPIGSLVGGLAGGLVGGAAGGVLGSAVQDFALSYVPDDVKKKMGLDDEQAILDESRHPYASQIGGLTPFLVTARPWAAPSTASIATTLTKRAGSEVLQRGFSGALMGGWEGANEAYHGNVDWNKVAIATAFGTMFPHQNKFGTKIIETGAKAGDYTLGKARDLGVFGPGHNEDTFQGDAEVNDVAKQASNQYARDEEAEVQGPRLPGPEQVTDTARKMEPELFTEYDRLTAIKDEARAAIDEINNGSPKRVSDLSKQLVQAQRNYSEFVKGRNGYEGGREARVLRQNIRTIQNEIESLSNRPMEHAETEGADNELTARHRQDLIKADESLRDLAPQITEAKRRAAIGLGRGDFIIEPKTEQPAAKGEQTTAPDYTADRKAIVKEAKQRMLDTGRSEEEAQAYGELTAGRYVSRASRFDGKLGTPLELYMSEGAHIRSWEPAKKAAPTPVAEKPIEAAPAEVTGEVSVMPEAEAAPAPASVEPAPVGPKAGDAITMNATKYKIASIDDNNVKLVPARVKDKAAPLTLKRNVFDQMFGEYAVPAAKQEGEKITLNGEPLDAKMAEVVRGLMEKQATPKESVPDRLPDTADMAALRERMRQEAMSDEYPVVEETPPHPAVVEAEAAIKKIDSIPPKELAQKIPQFDEKADALSPPKVEGGPTGIFMFNPTELKVDAKRFQFKEGGDEEGVTGRLKGVKKWDISKAGRVIAWQDLDGTLYVVDGHQRTGLARRLLAEGHPDIMQVPGLLYRAADGITAEDIRAIAAVTNISEGSGSALDGAKVLRSRPDLMDGSLPLSEGKARQAANLAKLGDEPFRMVVNEVVPEHRAAIVGEFIPNDPARQEAAIKAIARFKPNNEEETSALVQRVAQAELAKAQEGAQTSLFGDLESADSTAGEEMRIVGKAIAELKKDKSLFQRVVANAERIEQTGSNIEREAAQSVTNESDLFAKRLTTEAYTFGPLREEIKAAAKDLRDGKISINDATARIRSALRGAAEANGSAGRGDSESNAGSPASERTAAGEQNLIPGVNPVTDADRIAVEQQRRLTGGNEEPPAGGLFDESSRDQNELFQRRGNEERLAGFNTKTREIWLGKNADPSSIIHESGHQYLEELKRDAAHAEAPEQIKADIETVKDWVGWKRGQQDFTRKQHEKFAKGFERYLYDGIAPSKELAGAFERFTNWLRGIYQSIRSLKRNGIPELTPEIRSVFDRLLSTEPRRTIVAGEIKTERSLGAVHEAEAVKTTHREAAAVADRAAAERASFVKELPAQVNNELAAAAERNGRSVESLGASAERSRGMAEDSVGQGTRAGSSASSTNSGAQRGGRSENATEGAGASSGTDGNGYVPRERQTFASKEGKFVDKAGNIRLENITNEEDLRDAAREVAAQNDGFIGDRRGVVTDGQVHDLATAIGDEGAWRMVDKWAKGSAYNAEEIMAMRLLFQKQLAKVVDLAKAAKAAGEGDWQAMRDYAVERDRLVNIQKTVSGATAEWGRAGRSFRDISGSKDYQTVNKLFQENTGRTLFQTRVELDLLSKLDDPEAAANFLRNSDRPGFHRYILEYWINNLISGPVTHATYMVGNDLLALYRAIPETLARAAVGRAMQAAGRETATKDLVHFGEAIAQVKGFGEGFAPALKAAAGSLKTGVTTLLPGETMRNLPGLMPGQQYAKPEHMDASYKLAHVVPDMFGAIRGMKEAIIAYGQMLDKGVDGAPLWSLHTSPLGVIPDIAYKGVPVVPIGFAIRVPGRFIQAIHAFHRVNFYMMELNAEAYRRAAAEGLSGEEFAQRVAELKKNPDLDMIKRSADAATEGTMMGQGGEFTRNLARLTNTKILGVPWLKFIDPFVHITGNVIEQSLGRRTPLALFSPEMRADLSGKNGTYAQDKAMGRIMLGTAISAAVAGYVMDGFITGGGPKDREEKGNWERMGIQPYSIKIGDTWYSYHRLGALGLLIGVAADMYKVAKYAAREELAEAGASLLEAFSHNILEESFMRGPSELFRAIENPNQYGASWARNFLSSFAPASVGMSQITRATDPYSRQARTITDAFMGKYPWWSDQLQPRRDLWGEPIANKQLTLGTAIYQSPESRDPVNQEMYRLNVRKAPVDKKIRNIELSPEQYDDYARVAGRLTKMQLEQVVNSTDYQAMPDFQKMDVIDKVFNVTRKAARETILQKYPQLIHDAITLKMNRYSDEALERQ